MTIVCKKNDCPYIDKNNFCTKEVLAIDENAMCNVWWRNGQIKMVDKNNLEIKVDNIVEDRKV